jgi:hypothetical protein
MSFAKVYGGEAKLSGRRYVVECVIDENGPANVQAAPMNKQLEYCRVRLHKPDVARQDQLVERIEEGK